MDGGTWRCRNIVVEIGQGSFHVESDGLLRRRHAVLDVGYEAQGDVELILDQKVIACARCHIPNPLQKLKIQSARHKELDDFLAGDLAVAIRVDLRVHVGVEAPLEVSQLQMERLLLASLVRHVVGVH